MTYFVWLVDTCEEIDDIDHGQTKCVRGHTDLDMKVGDYCTFTCNAGTRLIGQSMVRCTKSGYDYTPPHCASMFIKVFIIY